MIIVIPTLNEEEGIRQVLKSSFNAGLEPIVLDSGSIDATRYIASDLGVVVLNAPKGKSNAFRHFIENSEHQKVIIIDGDGTYDPEEAAKLLEEGYDMVIGKRELSFFSSPVRFLGNASLNLICSLLYGKMVEDLLSGFRMIDLRKAKAVGIDTKGFELETELTSKFLKRGLKVKWVPIKYNRRKGNSKFRVVRDTGKILFSMITLRLSP